MHEYMNRRQYLLLKHFPGAYYVLDFMIDNRGNQGWIGPILFHPIVLFIWHIICYSLSI